MKLVSQGFLMVLLLFLLGSATVLGQISVEGFQPQKNLFPIVGKTAMVVSGKAHKGERLRVTYRPQSAVSHVEILNMQKGRVAWKPAAPGLVKLEVGVPIPGKAGGDSGFDVLDSKSISVRSDRPALGFGIMILAGLILFGGAAFSIRNLLAEG